MAHRPRLTVDHRAPMDHQRSRWREVSGRRPAMGDAALVAALRCEDDGALREFYLRFRPMLVRAAGRLGVDPGERDTLVDDCLADVAVHLITSSSPPPRSLPAYLARSLRNRLLNGARALARARRIPRAPQHLGPYRRAPARAPGPGAGMGRARRPTRPKPSWPAPPSMRAVRAAQSAPRRCPPFSNASPPRSHATSPRTSACSPCG